MHLFKPDTSFTQDYFEIGRYTLAWRLSLLFAVVFGLLSLVFLQIDIVTFYIYAFVFAMSLFCIYHLHRFKKWKPIFWMVTTIATILVALSLNITRETIHFSEMLWMICIILFAYIGLSPRVAILFAFINAISICVFIFFHMNEYLAQIKPVATFQLVGIAVEVILVFLVITFLIRQNIRFQQYAQDELLKSNVKLEAQNQENVLLLKEVHHRVKNNLQIVVSMLRIQGSDISSTETQSHFNDAINRIMTISLIHQKLYELGELSTIEFTEYIKDLVTEIKSLHISAKPIKKVFFVNVNDIDLKSVVPIGLIFNELITNSIKHAFDTTEHPQINIELFNAPDDNIVLLYSDNGVWKDSNKPGFGTELIQTLADQLDGKLTREKSVYIIIFPKQMCAK